MGETTKSAPPAAPAALPMPRRTAHEQYSFLQDRIAGINRSLGTILNAGGIPRDLYDRVTVLRERLGKGQRSINARWEELGRPLAELQEQHARRLAAMPTVEQAAANRKWAEGERQLDARFTEPDAGLDDFEEELDALYDESVVLFREATVGQSLKQAGVEIAKLSRTEFKRARNYHRRQQRFAFWAMVGVLILGAALLYLFFTTIPNLPEAPWWMVLAVLVGGRVPVLLAVAWMINFLGRLQAKHAQQAVRYQDRLVAAEAAEFMIQLGTADTRESILKRMAETQLSLEANAFMGAEVPPGYSPKELVDSASTLITATLGAVKTQLPKLPSGKE